jgi:voltage-gated potassium channel Kch
MPLLVFSALRAIWALRRDPQFVSLALLAAVAIVSGTAFYSLVEGLRFVDALYFSVVTLTTVGYGDFAPETDVGKLFTAVYVLVGIGILLTFITTLAAKVAQMPVLPSQKSEPTRGDGQVAKGIERRPWLFRSAECSTARRTLGRRGPAGADARQAARPGG